MATTKNISSAAQQKNYIMVSPAQITVDEKSNIREDYGDVTELKNSIIANGLRNPLKCFVKDGKVILREGFRRMRAVNLALKEGHRIERVPVIMDEKALTQEERTLEFLINNDGKPFTMLEQAQVIKQLLKFGWKVVEVVKRTGKARGYIENLIDLGNLPLMVENLIRDGKISAHAVLQIIAANKGDEQKIIADVLAAIEAAKEAGKGKATPKHVKTAKVKNKSYGKFYAYCEALLKPLDARNDVHVERVALLVKLMTVFENGQPAAQVSEGLFVDKVKKAAQEAEAAKKGKGKPAPAAKPAAKKQAPKKAKKK